MPTVLGNKPKPQPTATKNENDDENSDSDTDFFSLSKIDKEPEYDTSSVDLSMLDGINAPKESDVSEDAPRVSLLDKYMRNDDLTNHVSIDDTEPQPEHLSRIRLDEDAVSIIRTRDK